MEDLQKGSNVDWNRWEVMIGGRASPSRTSRFQPGTLCRRQWPSLGLLQALQGQKQVRGKAGGPTLEHDEVRLLQAGGIADSWLMRLLGTNGDAWDVEPRSPQVCWP